MPMNPFKFALDVQDACNISGVMLSFSRLAQQCCDDYSANARSMNRNEFFRTHPALILYLDKICDMMGWQRDHTGGMTFSEAYTKACDYATQAEPKAIIGYAEHDMNLARDDHELSATNG